MKFEIFHIATDIVKTAGTKSTDPLFRLINKFSSTESAVNEINEKFSSVFVPDCDDTENSNQPSQTSVPWLIDIPVSLVHRKLSKINAAKSMGNDYIPAILYKSAADALAGPLAHIYNLSVTQRRFPSIWKSSHVSPIPKSATPDSSNLRPISLLPIPSKILESIVFHSNVYNLFLLNFGKNQYGSRPASSTTCAVIKLIHNALSLLESPLVSGVQITAYDYTKAFDVLSHNLILRRLRDSGFPADFIDWTKDYLTGRSQAVRIGSVVSTKTNVTSGVPQGSVLGPALYCLTAGNIDSVHHDTSLIQYVDDTTLCVPLYKGVSNLHVVEEHANLLRWSSEKGLKINLSKCKSICISKSNNATAIPLEGVQSVDELRFLGVIINNKLTWTSHIEYIRRTASKRTYAIRLLKPLLPTASLITVYFATVRSILEYASPAFVNLPVGLSNMLEKLQNRFHKLICGSNANLECSCGRFTTLSSRRQISATRLFKKASNDPNHILHPIIPKRSARSNRFIQPPSNTSKFRNSYIPFTTLLINDTVIT